MLRQIPNLITASRLVFLGIIAWTAGRSDGLFPLWTFLLVLVASSTDWLDGYLARRFGWITNFGKIFDALVDKFLILGLFVILVVQGLLEPLSLLAWIVIALVFLRDFSITTLRFRAASRGIVLAAEKSGKRKTVWQIVAVSLLFFVPVMAFTLDAPAEWTSVVRYAGIAAFLYAGYLSVSSGVLYLRNYTKREAA